MIFNEKVATQEESIANHERFREILLPGFKVSAKSIGWERAIEYDPEGNSFQSLSEFRKEYPTNASQIRAIELAFEGMARADEATRQMQQVFVDVMELGAVEFVRQVRKSFLAGESLA